MESKPAMLALVAALLGGFLIFAAYGYLEERSAREKAESQTGQQEKAIEAAKQQQAAARAALEEKLTEIEQERKRPVTAENLVASASTLLPALPEPLQIEMTPETPGDSSSPAARAISIPQADFAAFRDAQLTCRENAARLDACTSSHEEDKQQLKLTAAQRDEWKTAAKGGSAWHRTLGAAKWFAIGAGSGAMAYAIAHHR